MSWLSDAWDGFCSVASDVWEGVKSVARDVVEWVADKASKVIDTVKKVWDITKKYIKPVLIVAMHLIPFPPLKAAIGFLVKAITFLEKVLDHPLAQKIRKAIQWCIDTAKKIKRVFLSEKDRREALERRKLLDQASKALPENSEEKQAVAIARVINDFVILQSEIEDYLQETTTLADFDHYLRLKATRKLLEMIESRLRDQGVKMFDVTDDDLFVLETGYKLIGLNPVLSYEETVRLDGIVFQHVGKNLYSYVFEELLFAWHMENEERAKHVEEMKKLVAKKKVELRSVEAKIKYGEEVTENVDSLRNSLEGLESLKQEAECEYNEYCMILNASEGYLQILEDSAKVKHNSYILDQSEKVGQLILQCLEFDKPFYALAEEDKSLIIDFANIFREDLMKRNELVQIGVS